MISQLNGKKFKKKEMETALACPHKMTRSRNLDPTSRQMFSSLFVHELFKIPKPKSNR